MRELIGIHMFSAVDGRFFYLFTSLYFLYWNYKLSLMWD